MGLSIFRTVVSLQLSRIWVLLHHITKTPAFGAGIFGTQTNRVLGGALGDGQGAPALSLWTGDYSKSV
jgi:hypothetical protein